MKDAVRAIAPSLIYNPVTNIISHKTRHLKTNEELELQATGLKELRDILLSLKIEYFISGGTLLGAIRESDFIKWDFDTDIDLDTRSVWNQRHQLVSILKSRGFEVTDYRGDRLGFKIVVTKYGELYELLGYLKIGKFRYRMDSYYPDAVCGVGTEVTLRGEHYRTFGMPVKYVEWFYGDWRSPVRSGVYVTTHSRVSPMRFIFIKIVSMFV